MPPWSPWVSTRPTPDVWPPGARHDLFGEFSPSLRPPPPRPPTGSGAGAWTVVVGLVLFAVLAVVAGAVAVRVTSRQVGTTAGPSTGSAPAARPEGFLLDGQLTTYPPPPADLSAVPLGVPPPPPVDPGPHAFMSTNADGSPVAYDPCRQIRLVVNTRTAVAGADQLLGEALVAVSQATGLQLVIEGGTDEPPSGRRQPVQVDRYGNRWAPVLVAWSDPTEEPALAGSVAGSGGSQSITSRTEGQRTTYVTGSVALDGPQLAVALRQSGRDEVRAVIEHELAHVVGLDHVDDASQLMAPETHEGVTRFGSGDLAGLARLGAGSCAPDL